MKNPKTYALQIQEGVFSEQDTTQLKKLLADYIFKTKLPPQIGKSVTHTLSNCKDTDDECTCQFDDC